MKTSQKTIISVTLSVVATTLVVGSIVFGAWNDPTATPPNDNTPTPINAGATAQTKDGPLTIKGIIETTLGGIKFPDGTVQTTATPADGEVVLAQSSCQWIVAPNAYNSGGQEKKAMCPAGQYLAGVNFWMQTKNVDDEHVNAYCCNPTASLSGIWTDKILSVVKNQDKGSMIWSSVFESSWTADDEITGVRVYGSSDDGGYCYAYWGTDRVATWNNDPAYGISTANGYYYDGNPIYDSSKLANMDTTCTDSESGTTYPCQQPYCTQGTLTIDPYTCGENSCSNTCQVGDGYCPYNPPSFTNNGAVNICQIHYNASAFSVQTKTGLSIPAGTVIKLQARTVNGVGPGNVSCHMDIVRK